MTTGRPAGRLFSYFCDAVVEVYRPGDVIWVQDYHLFTLPQLLRARLPHASIAFFLHTPFPSSALFLRLEIGEALLAGVLSADLAGFHTSNYAAHFLSACSRALGAEVTATSASLPSATSPLAPRKKTEVVVSPIGIDPLPFTSCLSHAATAERLLELKSFFGDRKLIVAVDRMDPIKGLLLRLHAFEALLSLLTPEQALAPPCLLSVAVPSREASRDYKLLRLSVEALTSSINSKFGKVGEPPPVSLFYRSISHSELCSLLCLGSLCLITSLRDGMNLVAHTTGAVKGETRSQAAGVNLTNFSPQGGDGTTTCAPTFPFLTVSCLGDFFPCCSGRGSQILFLARVASLPGLQPDGGGACESEGLPNGPGSQSAEPFTAVAPTSGMPAVHCGGWLTSWAA